MNEDFSLTKTIEGGVQFYSARELHEALGINEQFTHWFERKKRIRNDLGEAVYIENKDYISFSCQTLKLTGGRPKEDYHISIHMAKHLCMLSGGTKAYEIRNYFEECEKELAKRKRGALPSYPEALRQLAATLESNEQLKIENKELEEDLEVVQPKADKYDELMNAEGFYTIQQAAKIIGWGGNRLFKFLREKDIFKYEYIGGQHYCIPYQTGIEQGYFKVRVHKNNKRNVSYPRTYVSVKGLDYISCLVSDNLSLFKRRR